MNYMTIVLLIAIILCLGYLAYTHHRMHNIEQDIARLIIKGEAQSSAIEHIIDHDAPNTKAQVERMKEKVSPEELKKMLNEIFG